jgi:hypothetical protein
LAKARSLAFDGAQPRYAKAIARSILGKFGTTADLERLLVLYAELGDLNEQVHLMCSLGRLERGRRNAFLARAEGDGEMHHRAARLVRAAD